MLEIIVGENSAAEASLSWFNNQSPGTEIFPLPLFVTGKRVNPG